MVLLGVGTILCFLLFIFQNDTGTLIVFSVPVLLVRKPGLVAVRQLAPRHPDGVRTGWYPCFQPTSSALPHTTELESAPSLKCYITV